MGRKKSNKEVLSVRVDKSNKIELKKLVIEKDKELTESKQLITNTK